MPLPHSYHGLIPPRASVAILATTHALASLLDGAAGARLGFGFAEMLFIRIRGFLNISISRFRRLHFGVSDAGTISISADAA